MGNLFDIDLSGMAEKVGGLTKESVEELNSILRKAIRVNAATAILEQPEEGNRVIRKEALTLLTQVMRNQF